MKTTTTRKRAAFAEAEAALARTPNYTAPYNHGQRENAAFWKKRLGSYLNVLENMVDASTFEPRDSHWGQCKGNATWLQRGSCYVVQMVRREWLPKARTPEALGTALTGKAFADWLDEMWSNFITPGERGWPTTSEPHHLHLFNKGAAFAAATILAVLQAQRADEVTG